MATATKTSPGLPPSRDPEFRASSWSIGRGLLGVYRFLASLKLAVVSLATLAVVLAYGTFFESWHGTAAVQEWVYRSPWFILLLAALGTNIFCAAAIRFPWRKRQTGFVVTHVGLLVVLGGALVSLLWGDEGQVAFAEGEEGEAILFKPDHVVFRVRPLDPRTGAPSKEYEVPFFPGSFTWEPGRSEMVSNPGDPFKLTVKNFLPASAPRFVHEPVRDGVPMIRIAATIQPPGSLHAMDLFQDDLSEQERWFVADNEFSRITKEFGPARIVFQAAETPEALDDFLHPPKDARQKVARFHYRDAKGQDRVYEWAVEGQTGKSVVLPDSDLTAKLIKLDSYPDADRRLERRTGENEFPIIQFKIRKGNGPEVDHFAFGSLPAMTELFASHAEQENGAKPLARIGYFTPPVGKGSPRFGSIEILATPDGKLFDRVFGREGLKFAGPLELGKDIQAFGGDPNQPMSLSFRVAEFIPSGRERFTLVPIELPANEKPQGIPAALLEMTIDGETREFWVRRTGAYFPDFGAHLANSPNGEHAGPVPFSRQDFQVAYDIVREPLGFRIKLDDFDATPDPGSTEPSRFVSQIHLTDPQEGINNKPITISMNEPMTHRGWTFYQSNYDPIKDPRSHRPTGQFRSIFQVHYDPAWQIIYLGCLLVIVGTFLQFVMRAGIFTDGGKRERERAEARAARNAGATAPTKSTITDDPDIDVL